MPTSKSIPTRSRTVFLALCLMTVLPVCSIYSYATSEKAPLIPEEGFGVVVMEPMKVSIHQVGTVESGNNLTLINHCEWSTRIINLVPEGTWVEAGEIVAELDSSALRQRFDERQILVVNAEARLAQAEEDLELQRLANESSIAAAELKERLATLQLEGYTTAEHPQQVHEQESAVALAEEDLTRARKNYEFIDNMVRLGYRTHSDRENERLKLLKAEYAFENATGKLSVLVDHTHGRSLTKLKAAQLDAQFQLERVKNAGRSAMLSREAKLRSRQRSYEIYANYQERLLESIEACTVRAPKAGEVIHATVSSRSSRKLEEGSSVTFNQPLVKLPDRDRMQVKLRVHESLIQHVDTGHPAVVVVDAHSETQFAGRVTSVSKVPMPGQYPNYDLREYEVVVALDETAYDFQMLAPGMTASVEVVSAQRDYVLQVPIQSVARVAGRHVAFVRQGDNIEARDVTLGLANENSVEIVNGLQEGEELVLRPRITCAQRITALEGRALAGTANPSSIWTSL